MIHTVLFGLLTYLLVAAPGSAAPAPDRLDQDPLVLVEVPAESFDSLEPDPLATLRTDLCRQGRLVMVSVDGSRRELAPGFYSVCEPDVSFDGTRILFAGRPTQNDPWNIYELDLGAGEPRQITRQLGNCRNPVYLSTLFTIDSPEPWDTIAFVSDAAGWLNEAGSLRSTSLYSCRLDGSEVRRLTFNPSTDRDPLLLWDGRLVYSTWERSLPEHGPEGRLSLYSVNIDGTDVAPFAVHQGARLKQMPTATADGRCVFVESDTASREGGGRLGEVLLRRPHHTYRSLSGESDGQFHSPSPAGENRVLVSHLDKTYRVGIFDLGSRCFTALYERPNVHALYPRRIAPRSKPDGRSTVVEETRSTGQVYGISIGIHGLENREWLVPGMTRRLRVLEALPRAAHESSNSDSPYSPKRILGEVPVESDGSYFFEVPANIPIQLQLLDDDGLALQSCGWIWVKNREARGCIGCHEDPELTPPNVLPLAVQRRANQLTLPPARRRTVDFGRDLVPIVGRSCIAEGCHGAGSSLDLARTAGEPEELYARRVFERITASGSVSEGSPGPWVHPGRARTSPLIWHILGRRTSRPWDGEASPAAIPIGGQARLTPQQAQAFIEWIDLGACGPAPVPVPKTGTGGGTK